MKKPPRQYKPVGFGDGPVPGSVEDMHLKRQKRARTLVERSADTAYYERYPERKEDDGLRGWRRLVEWLRR